MKRIITLLFAMTLFISACASPAVSTSAPIEQVKATSTSKSTRVVPVENTATSTFTPEPTSTPMPVPPSPRWYWSVDDTDTAMVVAVNQFGERRELGALEQSDDLHTAVVSLDSERALLFLDSNDTLRVYLLTPDGMQKIKLPSEPFYFNTEFSQTSRAVIAVHEDQVVFSYVTERASNLMPDTGPILLMDLTALTTKLIDKTVSRDTFSNNSYWFHASPDGRYLRYLNGDREKMEIRELDMVTGEARTHFTTSGSSYYIRTSPQGDLWYLRDEKSILDLNGNQTPFTDETLTVRPLKDGKVVIFPRDCVDTCEIKVTTPFGNESELAYNFPWAIESATFYNDVSQLLPDQSMLFAGAPYSYLSYTPAVVETYPDLTGDDSPLFRLTPDGKARIVGIRAGNVSADGRYILLRSLDQTSFFIYDILADHPLFDMPVDTGLEDYLTAVRFFDTGILVNLDASVPGTKHSVYRFFDHVYVYETSASIAWEDVNAEINSCPDLLEDGTLVCWFYRADFSNFDLVRFDPATGKKTVLLENSWLIEFTP